MATKIIYVQECYLEGNYDDYIVQYEGGTRRTFVDYKLPDTVKRFISKPGIKQTIETDEYICGLRSVITSWEDGDNDDRMYSCDVSGICSGRGCPLYYGCSTKDIVYN